MILKGRKMNCAVYCLCFASTRLLLNVSHVLLQQLFRQLFTIQIKMYRLHKYFVASVHAQIAKAPKIHIMLEFILQH